MRQPFLPISGGCRGRTGCRLGRRFRDEKLKLLMCAVLTNRLTLRGFIVWDFAEQEQEFLDAVGGWIREGRIKYREDLVEGLENAPKAFQGLLAGRNFGKLVVKVSPDPTR